MVFPGSTTAQGSHNMVINTKPYGHLNATAGSSSIARFDPYAPPRRPVPSTSAASTSPSTPSKYYSLGMLSLTRLTDIVAIRFKSSPFIRVERAVSAVVECPGMIPPLRMWWHRFDLASSESSSAQDRRQQTVTFTLTSDYVAKLSSSR
jgi:E3 SUMO-protein ligase PIAS1